MSDRDKADLDRLRNPPPTTIAAIVREQRTGEYFERFYVFGDVDQARRFQEGAPKGVVRFLEPWVKWMGSENKYE